MFDYVKEWHPEAADFSQSADDLRMADEKGSSWSREKMSDGILTEAQAIRARVQEETLARKAAEDQYDEWGKGAFDDISHGLEGPVWLGRVSTRWWVSTTPSRTPSTGSWRSWGERLVTFGGGPAQGSPFPFGGESMNFLRGSEGTLLKTNLPQ